MYIQEKFFLKIQCHHSFDTAIIIMIYNWASEESHTWTSLLRKKYLCLSKFDTSVPCAPDDTLPSPDSHLQLTTFSRTNAGIGSLALDVLLFSKYVCYVV